MAVVAAAAVAGGGDDDGGVAAVACRVQDTPAHGYPTLVLG
jgi:hypothetical protein